MLVDLLDFRLMLEGNDEDRHWRTRLSSKSLTSIALTVVTVIEYCLAGLSAEHR